MTVLNGLTRPWDSFIQTLCARKQSMKIDIVWEDCIQEEARVATENLYSKKMIRIQPSIPKEENNQNSRKVTINLPRISFKRKRRITQSINATTIIR